MTAGGAAAIESEFVDLHAHSTASDGSLPPGEVVAAARRAGLSAVALTDHDSVEGVAAATAAGAAAGVRVVAGVELSAVEGDRETHLLGLHLRDTAVIAGKLSALRSMRRTRANAIVRRLNEIGVRITVEAVLEQAGDAAIGRPHVARALVGEGWAVDLRDAFDRYLGAGRPAFVAKEKLLLSDAIALIHRAGGLAVIAHPAQAGTRERIEPMVRVGLDGVEVRHPSHSAEDQTRLMALVREFDLIPSGGSDWHGAPEGARALGVMRVPASWLALQDDRLATRPLAGAGIATGGSPDGREPA